MESMKKAIKEQLLSIIKNDTSKGGIELYNFPFLDNYNIFSTICDSLLKVQFFSLNSINEIKFIFQNMKNFHRYLYNKDRIINISFKEHNINIAFLFYLDLLIKDNSGLINYSYSGEHITKINELQKMQRDPIIKIVCSKIIIDLINNYEDVYDFDEDYYEKYIRPIEYENKKLIKDNIQNINGLLEWNEDNILRKDIDLIYIEIIEALIKKGKFKDFEYVSNILIGLDFDLIDNTNKMKSLLIEIFNIKNLNKIYIIENENEIAKLILDESKINFYYFLIKYILKDSIDLYQYPLLLHMRNKLIKLIKEKPSELIFKSSQDKGTKERFYFIIKSLLDSKYYFKKFNIHLSRNSK